MAGQGTLGLELTEQVEAVEVVVVPVGGGGLISGVATAVKARWPGVRVVGVEPSGADDARRSLEAGERVALDRPPDTVVDGVRSPVVGERPWEVIRRLVDEIVTVTDTETVAAMELLWTRAKTVVEPAGAMPLAALVTGRIRAASAAVVLSGGNVDLQSWHAIRG
jgi:threonine dehydratase